MKGVKLAIFLNYFCIIITNLSSVLLTPVLIKGLGQEHYGVYILVFTTVLYFALTEFGMGHIVVNHVAKYRKTDQKEEGESFLFISLVTFVVLASAAFVICMIINAFAQSIFNKTFDAELLSEFRFMFLIMSINTFILFLQTFFFSVIAGYEKFIFTRTILIIRLLLRTALILVFMQIGTNASAIYIMELAFTSITTLLFIGYAFIKLKVSIKFSIKDKVKAINIFKHTTWSYVYIVLENTYWNICNLLVGACLGPSYTSVYSIAMTFCLIFTQLTTTITGYFMPSITHAVLNKADGIQLSQVMIKVARMLMMILTFAVIGFGAFGKQIIMVWLGPEFESAYIITFIIYCFLLFPQVQIIGDIIVQAKGKFGMRTLIAFFGTLVSAVTSYFFISNFGLKYSYLGIVISTFLFRFVATSLYYHFNGLHMRLFVKDVYIKMVLPILITGVGCYIVNLFGGDSFILLLLKILVVSILYVLNLWLFYLSKDERKNAKETINSLLKKGAKA